MKPLLTLLEAFSFEVERRGTTRTGLLAQMNVTNERFNALIGRRAQLTPEEERAFLELVPVSAHVLFWPGPSRFRRHGEVRATQEIR